MAIAFKHLYKSDSPIGTGAVKFRPYTVAEPLPQLATPANVSADGTTVSWDEVENATSYEVIEGGNKVLGTVDETPTPSGHSVTVTGNLEYTGIEVYDTKGGTLLYKFNSSDTSHTFTGITSLFIDAGVAARAITSVTTTAGITSNRTTGYFYDATITAGADGTVTIVQENNQ